MSIDQAIADAVDASLARLVDHMAALRTALEATHASNAPKAYTVKGAATALGVSESTVRTMIADGHLRAVVLPGMTERRITAADLDELIAAAVEYPAQSAEVIPITSKPSGSPAA